MPDNPGEVWSDKYQKSKCCNAIITQADYRRDSGRNTFHCSKCGVPVNAQGNFLEKPKYAPKQLPEEPEIGEVPF